MHVRCLEKSKKTYSPKKWWFDVDFPVKNKKTPSTNPKINMTMENPSMNEDIVYLLYNNYIGGFQHLPTNPRFNPWHSFGPPWVVRLRCGAISPTLSPSDARASVRTERCETKRFTRDEVRPSLQKKWKKHGKKSNAIQEMNEMSEMKINPKKCEVHINRLSRHLSTVPVWWV